MVSVELGAQPGVITSGNCECVWHVIFVITVIISIRVLPVVIGPSYRTRLHNHHSLIAELHNFPNWNVGSFYSTMFSSFLAPKKQHETHPERRCVNNVRIFFPFVIIAFCACCAFRMKEPMNNYSNANNKIEVHPIKATCTTNIADENREFGRTRTQRLTQCTECEYPSPSIRWGAAYQMKDEQHMVGTMSTIARQRLQIRPYFM